MKIVITADLHLTSRARNPERFETLERLFNVMRDRDLPMLVIAGDLFDASRQDYADFEELCARDENRDLTLLVIPGNHDAGIDDHKIVAHNVRIFTEPTIELIDGRPFLFLPYEEHKTMGEPIAQLSAELPPERWVLVGHGDFSGRLRQPNPLEPGVYMMLTRQDIAAFRPARVFLGHIHLKLDSSPVYYPGSPCGLDISETGRRRCLIFDTESNQVEPLVITPPVLFFNESFVIVPVEDEANHLRKQIRQHKAAWNLKPEETASARIRVRVDGYASDRQALQQVLDEEFAGYTFYRGEKPDVKQVEISEDLDRQSIAQQAQSARETLELPGGRDDPSWQEVLLEALRIIYRR